METFKQYGNINPILQQYSDTCAIKSQQLILNDYGIDMTEDQLVQYSIDHGWYDGHGTKMEDIGKLLADAGIPVVQVQNADVNTLINELAQGHKVIVGVDADELWYKDIMTPFNDMLNGETPNHALIAAGINTTDPEHMTVLLTDPGTGDYCKEYPLELFKDAWHDSKCFMVSTQIPAPLEYNPEMIHFDYSLGHLATVGTMPYEQFVNDHVDTDFSSLSASADTFGGQAEWQADGGEFAWLMPDHTLQDGTFDLPLPSDEFLIDHSMMLDDDTWHADMPDIDSNDMDFGADMDCLS